MHHLKSLGELKLELLSGNAQLRSKSAIFLSHVTLKFNGWPWKAIGHLFYAILSFVHYFKAIGEFKLELVWKCSIRVKIGDFSSQIWWMTLKNNRASLLCCFKPCASFHNHQWIQTKVTVLKRSIRVKICDFFVPCDLEIWPMTLKNNRAPLLCYYKLCASFHSHWWIQTGVTVRRHPIWIKRDDFFSRETLKFDGWPWKTIGHLF